jgi:GT2 family glycosyltransferase
MKLSIIIVNFNTKDYLTRCLSSISKRKNYQIIVVDNASTDGSQAMVKKRFPHLKLITNKKNLGFSRANNIGLKQAKGKYVLLLNSDTKIFPQTLPRMLKFMENHPQVGAATCRVELPDGQIDPASHRGFPTPWAALTYFLGLEKLFPRCRLLAQYHQGWKNLKTIHEIDSPAGAFYLIRKKVIDQVGLLDEDYFMYGEDLDWSRRIKKAGWKIMYVPVAKIIHYKKTSGRAKTEKGKITRQAKSLRRQTSHHFFTTMKLFYDKHYYNQYPRWMRALVLLGIWFISKFRN